MNEDKTWYCDDHIRRPADQPAVAVVDLQRKIVETLRGVSVMTDAEQRGRKVKQHRMILKVGTDGRMHLQCSCGASAIVPILSTPKDALAQEERHRGEAEEAETSRSRRWTMKTIKREMTQGMVLQPAACSPPSNPKEEATELNLGEKVEMTTKVYLREINGDIAAIGIGIDLNGMEVRATVPLSSLRRIAKQPAQASVET
jgi:hypothetical protein